MRLAFPVVLVLSMASLGSTNIHSDLMDFYNVLPTFRLRLLVAKHYIFDSSFRRGLKFFKSNEFKELLRRDFANSPEVQDIDTYLDTPVTLDFVERSFRSVSVTDEASKGSIRPRSFVRFVDELIALLPINKVKQMISQKVNTNAEFHNVYARITEPAFKMLVYRARNAESLRNAIRKLESNEIKVDHILQSVFAVLNKLTN